MNNWYLGKGYTVIAQILRISPVFLPWSPQKENKDIWNLRSYYESIASPNTPKTLPNTFGLECTVWIGFDVTSANVSECWQIGLYINIRFCIIILNATNNHGLLKKMVVWT